MHTACRQGSPRGGVDWSAPMGKALHTAILELANGADYNTLDALLRACPADLTFASGATLLHTAAAANRGSTVQVILHHGADPLKPDQSGATPLHAAAAASAVEAVEALLGRAAGCEALLSTDNEGRRPIDCVTRAKASASAAAAKKVRKLLESASATGAAK